MMKIKDLFNLEKGNLQSSKCTPGEFDFITASREWKAHNEFSHECEALIFAAAASGSLGRTHYVNGKFITSDLCFVVTPKNKEKFPIDLKFYHIIFNTLKDDIVKNTKAGTSKEAIGLKALGEYELPYFDINKQKEISRSFGNSTEISDKLTIEFGNQLSLISQLRQAFLREAMQGKLVSNETSDDKTGQQLLEEIRLEKERLVKEKKIKKQKPLPPISEEEIPFEIPENWAWCRLGDVNNIVGGGTPSMSKPEYWNGNVSWISPKDMKSHFVSESEMKITNIAIKNSTAKLIPKNSLLIVGRSGILKRKLPVAINKIELTVNQDMKVLIPYIPIHFFLQKCLLGLQGIILKDYVKYGMTVHSLKYDEFALMPIPLPPLEIQERIVAKLDELMQYCDDLEAAVKESQTKNAHLLQQVLREALEGKSEKTKKIRLVADTDEPAKSTKKYQMNDMPILAGHIINTLSTENKKDFGRVKLQKMLHLLQYHCELDLPLTYQKNVAGPYTRDLEKQIEFKLKQLRFFDIQKIPQQNYDMVSYTPLSSAKELDRLFINEFGEDRNSIDSLLGKFRSATTSLCERVSTMYAVWNNRILANEPITDDLLKIDFLNWDEGKKKFASQLDDTLDWMRRNGIVPRGVGKMI